MRQGDGADLPGSYPGENRDRAYESTEPNSESPPVAAIAGGSAMQASGSDAAQPAQRGDSGTIGAVGAGAAMASRTATGVGGTPPPGGSSPGGGGGGVGGSSRRTRLLLAILLVVLTVLLIAGITVAALVSSPAIKATVTITPASKDLANTYVITAVTGHPDPTKRQVQARILTYTTPPQKTTANATGSIPGRKATGQLTFYNGAVTTGQTVVAGTIFTAAHGVRVVNDVDANIPKANPPIFGSVTVPAHAFNAGVSGNISAGDANQAISTTITVKNLSAFSGGQDAVPNTVIQQSDINGAAEPILKELTPEAKAAVQKQVKPNEQVVPSTLKCTNIVTADPKAGAIAKTSTVTVVVTCTEEVYDHQGATTMADSLLTAAASKDPGPDYKLTGPTATECPTPTTTPPGKITTAVTQATVVDTRGTVSLLVRAEGVWVYDFCAKEQVIKNHIANKSKDEALGYLMCLPGFPMCLRDLKGQPVVSSVQIDVSKLPDASDITLIIKSVQVAPGTPTVTPGSPTPTATPTITPTPGLGGS